jgi:hypothetical protein
VATDKKTTHYSTYPKVAVQWLNQALCFYQSFCLVNSEVLQNRHLRVAAKRYAKAYETTRNNKYCFDKLLFCNYVDFVYLYFIKFAFNKNALFLSWINTKAFINTVCWTFKP